MRSVVLQVHVRESSLTEHLCGSVLAGCVSTDPCLAPWLHACLPQRSVNQPLLKQLPCQPADLEVCQIKPSTMYFTQAKMSGLQAAGQDRLVSVSQGGSNYRVCYSNHASLSELETFVRHFSPVQITPCAIPPNSSKEEVREILTSFLQSQEAGEGQGSSLSRSSSPSEEKSSHLHTLPGRSDLSQLTTLSRKRKFSSCGSGGGNFSDGNTSDEVTMMVERVSRVERWSSHYRSIRENQRF